MNSNSIDFHLKEFNNEHPNFKTNDPKPEIFDFIKTFHSLNSFLTEFSKQNHQADFAKFLLLNPKKSTNSDTCTTTNFSYYKHIYLLLNSMKFYESQSKEMSLILNLLINSKEGPSPQKLLKHYFKAKKIIHEEIFKTNACKCLDGFLLTLDQWVNIVKKTFVDKNPIEKVNKISENPLISKNRDQLPAVLLLEVLISELLQNNTNNNNGEIIYILNKRNIIREENTKRTYNEIIIENDKLKAENIVLLERLSNFEEEQNNLQKKIAALQEFQEVISKAYKDLMSYAYHLENSSRTIVEIVKIEQKNNYDLIEKLMPYKQDENQTLLPIFYLTLIESLEILKSENIISSGEDFSDFLEMTSKKSFQDRAKSVKRYDDFEYVLHLFRKKEENK